MIIYPFRGILYNKKKIKNLSKVCSPPYDVISSKQQEYYYRSSPYNIIRIILNKPAGSDNEKNNTYTRAAEFFTEWNKNGILIQDTRPAIYAYGQTFEYKNKARKTMGFIAIAKIAASGFDCVLPHEKTFNAPKLDRERLLASVGANLSCIYTLFEDETRGVSRLLSKLSARKPYIDVMQDKVRHKIWRVTDDKLIKKIQQYMASKKLFIADGHHRYEAAVNYRNRLRQQDSNFNENNASNYVMLYFGSLEDRGLTILPTHRLLKGLGNISIGQFNKRLEDFFEVVYVKNLKALLGGLDRYFGKAHAFGLYINKQFRLLRLRPSKALSKKEGFSRHYKNLDVVILHKIIFDEILGLDLARKKQDEVISYSRDAQLSVQWVDEGKYKAAFFLNPTDIRQVRDICLAGEKMPHKSTYFYPKLLTGLVMRKLDDV
jgi:uncharacterized protein (DUF1015 family)